MTGTRSAFLNANDIVSIIDSTSGDTIVRMRDGREFSVISTGAVESWANVKDVIDPQSDTGPLPTRDPFVQFSLKPGT